MGEVSGGGGGVGGGGGSLVMLPVQRPYLCATFASVN